MIALACLAVPAGAQDPDPPPDVVLGAPAAVITDAFSSIRGIRALEDGRLLVADWIEETVSLVDLDAGSLEIRVRRGSGPDEIRLPVGLWAIPGDSSLLADQGNARLAVLGPDGEVARTIPAERPGLLGARGFDGRGEIPFAVPAWSAAGGALPDDSVRLMALDFDSGELEPVTTIQGVRRRQDQDPSRELRLPVVGYAAHDAWAVTAEGRVVVVRAGTYSVEFHSRDGRVTAGPEYAYPTREVTEDDRVRFVADFLESSAMSGRGEDGGLGRAVGVARGEVLRLVETTEFAERHPYFVASGLFTLPEGGVWVEVGGLDSDSVFYDVFDDAGRRTGRVRLEGSRRVGAVTDDAVFVILTSEFGLQSIERYERPR